MEYPSHSESTGSKNHWLRWTNPAFQFAALIVLISGLSQCSPLAPSQQFGGGGGGGSGNGGLGIHGSAGPGVEGNGTRALVRSNLKATLASAPTPSIRLTEIPGELIRNIDSSVIFRLALQIEDVEQLVTNGQTELFASERFIALTPEDALEDGLARATVKAVDNWDSLIHLYHPSGLSQVMESRLQNLQLRVEIASAPEDLLIVLHADSSVTALLLQEHCRWAIEANLACDIELR